MTLKKERDVGGLVVPLLLLLVSLAVVFAPRFGVEVPQVQQVIATIVASLAGLGLPDLDGLEVTKRLREFSSVPIIVLSARGREDDKVAALDAGADDYVTKPFGMNELLARMRVAARHRHGQELEAPVLELEGLRLDFPKHEVWREGEQLKLTPLEFKLLAALARNAGKVLTHRQLLKDVWGPAHTADTHSLRVYMANLRKKLERDPAAPKYLLTEPGVGYRLHASDA